MECYNIEDPSKPYLVSEYIFSNHNIFHKHRFKDWEIQKDAIYLLFPQEISIISMEDPTSPFELSSFTNKSSGYDAFQIQGDFIYVLDSVNNVYEPRIITFDISLRTNITETHWYSLNSLLEQNNMGSFTFRYRDNLFQTDESMMYFILLNTENGEEALTSFKIRRQSIPILKDQFILKNRYNYQINLYNNYAVLRSYSLISIINLNEKSNSNYEALFNSTAGFSDFVIIGNNLILSSNTGLIITDLEEIDLNSAYGIKSITGFPIYFVVLLFISIIGLGTLKHRRRVII